MPFKTIEDRRLYHRIYTRLRRKKKIKAGCCVLGFKGCKAKASIGAVSCKHCRDLDNAGRDKPKRTKASRSLYAKRRGWGFCVWCGKVAAVNPKTAEHFAFCNEHKDLISERNMDKRERRQRRAFDRKG